MKKIIVNYLNRYTQHHESDLVPLGSGSYAEAWQVGDRVYKVTEDVHDFVNSTLVMGGVIINTL